MQMRMAIPYLITLIACAGAGALASAQTNLSEAQARAVIAPFYDALNKPSGKDVAGLLSKATGPGYQSCSGNEGPCNSADKVAAAMSGFGKAIPDLQWEVKEVLLAGNKIIVRGEATGTPAGEFFGVPHTGKSFRTMSIDIHTVEGGKITRSHHVEDWASALRQLRAP